MVGYTIDLQQLRSEIPQGLEDHSVVWTMAKGDKNPHRVDVLDTTKPCVFFFGGGAYLAKGEKSVPSQMASMSEMLAPIIQEPAYHFYTLTSDTKEDDKVTSMSTAGKKNQVYNDYPKLFYSPEAESFVASYLMPLVTDITHLQAAERTQAMTAAAKHFSAISFFGFSYGTAFIQEITNALNKALDEKGYATAEKATLMNSLAAVNIGPTFKYVPKYPDIPQTTLVLANDKDAVRESGISLTNPDIDFTHTPYKLAYAQQGTHTLVYAHNGSSRLRGLGYRSAPPLSGGSLETLIDQAKNWADSTSIKEDEPVVFNQVVPPHNKQLQTASLRWDVNSRNMFYIFPSNLVGTNSVRFLQAAVAGSEQALHENTVRDATSIANHCVAENLSDAALERDTVQTHFFKQLFNHLSGPSSPAK